MSKKKQHRRENNAFKEPGERNPLNDSDYGSDYEIANDDPIWDHIADLKNLVREGRQIIERGNDIFDYYIPTLLTGPLGEFHSELKAYLEKTKEPTDV